MRALKRFTDRIRKAWAETAPATTEPTPAPRRNPSIEVEGRLCLAGASDLRRRLFRLLHGGHRCVTMHAARVRFIDGCALAVLVEFAQACRDRNVTFKLVEPSPPMWNAFAMYGLRDVLDDLADCAHMELEGVLIILEEDFPDSIRLPAVAAPQLVIEEDDGEEIHLHLAA